MLSYHFTHFLYISTAYQPVSFVMAEPLWHSNTNRHSFSSAAPLWGFCCRKRQRHRAVLSDSVMNLNNMCHSADLHGFQQHGCMDVGMEICPRPASCKSALITASKGLTVLQRSKAHFAINKGWRLHLLASLLCRGIRQGVEAALWNPGILVFQSSSSGRRTARSGTES